MNLVLVPGLLCDQAVWKPQIKALKDLARIQVADHGELDSLGAMAEAILAKAPASFAVAGHSMGGRVALEVVRRAASRITGLALLDTGYTPLPAGVAGEKEAEGRHELLNLARQSGMRAVGERWLRIPMIQESRLKERRLVEAILRMFERRTPDEFAAQIRALLHRPDATTLLPMISCPTLVLCGQDDAWAPLSTHRVMAQLIPHSTLVAVPSCGHMSTMERPDEVSAALRTWLTRVAKFNA
ncbi:MAG TPA: alpha/beta hydrolase [Steroidobacteraceae bacterium]|nr:alpha/beta hydrolase [Steroidobacteraceae bacterium]